jgi:hypothetical protein
MHKYTAPLMAFVLCIAVAVAGCAGTSAPPPAATPAPAAAAHAAPTAATVDLSPSPTDDVLPANAVNLNVEKDYLGDVIVTFQGGPGLHNVRKIDVTLNRADGEVRTSTVGINLEDSAKLEGTKDTDRVIVFVTMADGKAYRVIDELVPYKTRS